MEVFSGVFLQSLQKYFHSTLAKRSLMKVTLLMFHALSPKVTCQFPWAGLSKVIKYLCPIAVFPQVKLDLEQVSWASHLLAIVTPAYTLARPQMLRAHRPSPQSWKSMVQYLANHYFHSKEKKKKFQCNKKFPVTSFFSSSSSFLTYIKIRTDLTSFLFSSTSLDCWTHR